MVEMDKTLTLIAIDKLVEKAESAWTTYSQTSYYLEAIALGIKYLVQNTPEIKGNKK